MHDVYIHPLKSNKNPCIPLYTDEHPAKHSKYKPDSAEESLSALPGTKDLSMVSLPLSEEALPRAALILLRFTRLARFEVQALLSRCGKARAL